MDFAGRAALVTQYGIPVMPLLPRQKKAFLEEWPTLATVDADQIARWNKENPKYNCGAVGLPDGVWIFEIDNPTLYARIEKETGHSLDDLDTLVVKSSGEKRHFYLKQDSRSESLGNFSFDDEAGEVFSVRAHNAYVVGPGSIHPDTGQPYEIMNEPTWREIPMAPDWLMDWLVPYSKKVGSTKSTKIPETIPMHSRNKTLTSLAGAMRRKGANGAEILAALRVTNQRCQVPLAEDELATIAASISRYAPAKTREENEPAEVSEPENSESNELVRPTLSETAYYGLAGAIVKKLEPCTESHPAGLLLELMISFGNMLGRSAYIQVEDTKHFTNEFMVKVGESSRSRKGTGKNRIRAIMEQVDPEWLRHRNVSGIGSGEVIIHLIRDPHTEYFFDKKKGTGNRVVTDAGIDDKRLCVNLGEFQGILSVCHRPDNLLSVVMRDGWDGLPLHNLVKTNPASCAEGLLSLLADVTRADLTVSLSQADRANGFANRFLWAYVYRTKLLPEGGGDMDWTVEVPQLRDAVEFGREIGRVFMDKAARDRWCRTVYPKLERDVPGIVGALTARASAHTMRLALLYALLDKSGHIRLEHLEAAEALWQYCEDSVQAIFGDLLSPEQSKILEFLASMDYASKKHLIHDCFKKNRKADLIETDLQVLELGKKITKKLVNGVNQYRLVRRS